RGYPAGPGGCLQGVTKPDHAHRADVFERRGKHHRKWRRRKRFATAGSWWIALVCAVPLFLTACKGSDCVDFYHAAAQQVDLRENKAASKLVEAGLNRTGNDPVCNYKFRILKARLAFSQRPRETLQLLETSPPPELQSGEFQVRRKQLQGEAEGALGHYQSA